MSDVVLVDRVKAGDRAALGQIYDRHVRSVYRYALSELRSLEDAEDLTQETFLTLFQRARATHLVDQSVLPWLLVTCRNHCRNRQRAVARDLARRATNVGDIESRRRSDDPEASASVSELQRAVREAVDELSPTDRRLFELCIDGDASYSTAAKTLGVSHGTVRNRLSRLRTRLQKVLSTTKEVKP